MDIGMIIVIWNDNVYNRGLVGLVPVSSERKEEYDENDIFFAADGRITLCALYERYCV